MSTLRTNEVAMLDGVGKAGFTFDSVAQMKDSTQISVGQKVRTLGYYAPGDGGGNDYEIVSAGTGSNYGFLYEQLTGTGLEAKLVGGGIMEDKTAYIPTDYDTLQEAIEDLSKIRPLAGANIVLTIETGEVIDSQLILRDGHYGHFIIRSVDAEVVISREAITTAFPTYTIGTRFPVFAVSDGTLPVIDALFNMDTTGTATSRDGVVVQRGRGLVMPGAGVKNAGSMGIVGVSASNVVFNGAIFTGSGLDGERSRGAYCFSSVMTGRGSDTSDAQFRGFECRSGRMDIQAAIADNVGGSAQSASGKAVYCPEGGVVSCPEIIATNAEERAIQAFNGGIINARGADTTGAGVWGFDVSNGGVIAAEGATGTIRVWPNLPTVRGVVYSDAFGELSVTKGSVQTVNNTSTLVDCDGLSFKTLRNHDVYFEFNIRHQSVTGGNLKIGFRSDSGSAVIRWSPESGFYQDVSEALSFSPERTESQTLSVYSSGATTVRSIKIVGVVLSQATDDEIFLQFSQDTATSGDTSVSALSSRILTPVIK